ncbi:hypothetical protein [Senegalia massiliensis]|uniref:SinR family protein n=1 Tax=Senegalia massiliensis TaxID=1720316 RepID=A0A845QX32_9CLOT|nr:hypothetical protein [Senegalia massiliensis]NBI06690.1 hypothetical protein [Senegalia massiliensis]
MAVYLISYDLNKPDNNYESLYETIKSYEAWWHHLDSTWIIETSSSCQSVSNNIKSHIHSDDNLLIIEVKNNFNGMLPNHAWEYLRKRNY